MVPPSTGEDEIRSPGATLTEDEIIEKLEKGAIKLGELTPHEKEIYGKYANKNTATGT